MLQSTDHGSQNITPVI